MTLNYNNTIDAVPESSEQGSLDKQSSDLMIKIHTTLDLRNAPIKTIVQTLGVAPEQARNLAKGNIDKFSIYELQTFLERLSTDIKSKENT